MSVSAVFDQRVVVSNYCEVRAARHIVTCIIQASTITRASPSTGEYLDSALKVKQLPINVIFHPDLQQSGWLESGSGVLRYCSMTLWERLVFNEPFGSVLSTSIRFTVFMASSVRVLLCGNVTEDRRCKRPQLRRNCWVELAVNLGPSSSLMPYVIARKVRRREAIGPAAPSVAISTIAVSASPNIPAPPPSHPEPLETPAPHRLYVQCLLRG